MKNKTIAVWLTLILGPVGAHRLYLKGKFDSAALALSLCSATGLYGVLRARSIGLDDQASWLLVPWLGFAIAASALTAIVYGLTDGEKWNRTYNTDRAGDAPAGQTNWLTVIGLGSALLIGATALLASIAFTFQRYFEYEAEQSQARSGWVQPPLSNAAENKVHGTHQA